MKVLSVTPSRVDFAGGTLDLYPLYLFMDNCVTVNGGITIYSKVEMETREDKRIHIFSEDLNEGAEFASIGELDLKGTTSFIQRAIKSYSPSCGLNVRTKNDAPKGSGLGASSSLLMALSAALLKVNGEEINVKEMIDRGASIEAGHLGIPTGKQDYYGAVLGKIHALHFNEGGCRPQEISAKDKFREELDKSLIVSFTGISHYSGANNWDMLKMAIDRVGDTYENLLNIRDITTHLVNAFTSGDLEKAAHFVNEEWNMRKTLAPGVTNDFIDGVMKKALDAGAWGGKLCGAGGGGCMITLTPAGKKAYVEQALKDAGVKIMDARIDYSGMKVEVTG